MGSIATSQQLFATTAHSKVLTAHDGRELIPEALVRLASPLATAINEYLMADLWKRSSFWKSIDW